MIRRIMRTILHRSLPAVAASLVLAAPAGAAEVARIDGARLDARDDARSGFCLRVSEGGSEFDGGSSSCGRAPWRDRRSVLIPWPTDDRVVAAGAVPASIARAEAELADGRRVGFETVAGPRYRGRHAGRLRFFLAALPVTDPRDDDAGGLVAVRFFGADGRLQGAAAPDGDGRPVGRSRVLLRERARGASIVVRSEVRRRLAPTPTALDRFEEATCLSVRSRSGSGGSESGLCHEPGPSRPRLAVEPEPGCGRLRTVIAGFVGGDVPAVRLRLGSGRVRRVATRILRGADGEAHRYLATVVPRGEAVRSVTAVGSPVGYELAEPPGGLPCITEAAGIFSTYAFEPGVNGPARPPAGDEQVAAEAAGHRLLVRDAEADRLCAGVDGMLADGTDCGLPPLTADDVFAVARRGVVSAVLPAEVARVRLPGGRVVATVEGGYTGRFAGAVRFLLVAAPEDEGARLRMLDSAGRVIGSLPVYSPEPTRPSTRPARLAGGRGWRLTAERYADAACLAVRLGGGEPECIAPLTTADGAFAAVGCTPRAAVIVGELGRATRSVTASLRGGRTLHARVLRVPRRIGRGRAFVLALPRGAEVRALRFDRRRVTFPLLPAARQCGYRVYAPFLSPPAAPRR